MVEFNFFTVQKPFNVLLFYLKNWLLRTFLTNIATVNRLVTLWNILYFFKICKFILLVETLSLFSDFWKTYFVYIFGIYLPFELYFALATYCKRFLRAWFVVKNWFVEKIGITLIGPWKRCRNFWMKPILTLFYYGPQLQNNIFLNFHQYFMLFFHFFLFVLGPANK